MRGRMETIFGGLVLIALGFIFLLAQRIGWNAIWPIFPMFGGLAFLVGYAGSGFRDSGLVFVGTAGLLVGLFFFGFTLGIWEWAQMATLWPVFPLIGGVAFVALFAAERGRDVGTLGVGCAAIVVGLVGLAVSVGFVGRGVIRLWPLLLIIMGVVGLIGALVQMVRRN